MGMIDIDMIMIEMIIDVIIMIEKSIKIEDILEKDLLNIINMNRMIGLIIGLKIKVQNMMKIRRKKVTNLCHFSILELNQNLPETMKWCLSKKYVCAIMKPRPYNRLTILPCNKRTKIYQYLCYC